MADMKAYKAFKDSVHLQTHISPTPSRIATIIITFIFRVDM